MQRHFFEEYVEKHPDQFPKKDISNRTRQHGDVDFKEFVESLIFKNTPTKSPAEENAGV